MAFCVYADGSAMMGQTTVANMFILEYMPSAPGDYVKVYLFGLMLCSHPEMCDGLESMADALHMELSAVKSALSHWEREGLVVKKSDNPPSYDFVALSPSMPMNDELDDDVYPNRSYIKNLQSLMPTLVIENHELRMANDWLDVFGLSQDAVMLLVESEIKRRGNRLPGARTMFKHLNEAAKSWAEAGVSDLASAQEYLARNTEYYSAASAVLERFNQSRKPTQDELNLAKKWTGEWKISLEDILSACEETTKGTNPSFGYLDKVLETRRAAPDDGSREKVKKLNAHLGIASRPTPEQVKALKSFLNMGFEFEAIEEAAKDCGAKNRQTYEDIGKKLSKWKEIGALTVKDIEEERARQAHYSGIMNKVFETAGVDRKINMSDLNYIRVWTALMDTDTVLFAAECARGSDNPVKYIDKLVKIWSAQGISTLEKAKERHEAHRLGKNPYKITTERKVTNEDFGDDFYTNIMNLKRAGE